MMPNPFGPIYSVDFVILVICAVAWYKAANLENIPPWIWAGISVFTYVLTWLWLGWGIIGCLFGQVVLMIIVAIVRVWRESRRRE